MHSKIKEKHIEAGRKMLKNFGALFLAFSCMVLVAELLNALVSDRKQAKKNKMNNAMNTSEDKAKNSKKVVEQENTK